MSDDVFQPNNHSKWLIEYKEVGGPKFFELKEILKNFYGLDDVLKIEQVLEVEVNSNNFKITLGNGKKFLLRKHIANKDKNIVDRTFNIVEYLKSKNVKTPKIIKNIKGETIIGEDEIYTLFEFLEANHYRGTLAELKSAGLEIGRLDQALADLPDNFDFKKELSLPEKVEEMRSYSLDIWQQIFNKAREKSSLYPQDPFHKEFLEKEEFIIQTVKENTRRSGSDVFGVVHFDLHPHNLLADGKEIVSIIDFDSLRFLEKMRALSFAIHRMVRQYIIYNNLSDYSKFAKEAKNIFLESYKKVCDIEESKLEDISYFVKDEALCRLTFAMKDEYFNDNSAWRQDLHKQLSNIKEADYLS